ncbi:MAG TPA: TetR/AcrR family transcriptional regulator [Acidimicrobiia bacterium]|jgi:AcrR family transcriptional regulator
MTTVATEASTRDRLVTAAIEVFVDQGYEQARVQDIARAAGLTTGAIYANFRDKRELLLAAIADRSAAEVETLLQAAANTPPRDLLAALGSRIAFRENDRPLLLDAVVASERDADLAVLLRDALAQRHGRIADLVEHGKSDRTIDPAIDTDVFTRFCLTLALGSLVVRALALPQPDPDQWGSLIERLLDASAPTEVPS